MKHLARADKGVTPGSATGLPGELTAWPAGSCAHRSPAAPQATSPKCHHLVTARRSRRPLGITKQRSAETHRLDGFQRHRRAPDRRCSKAKLGMEKEPISGAGGLGRGDGRLSGRDVRVSAGAGLCPAGVYANIHRC